MVPFYKHRFPRTPAMRQGGAVKDNVRGPVPPLGLIVRVKHLIRANSWCCVCCTGHHSFFAAALSIPPLYSFFFYYYCWERNEIFIIFVALLLMFMLIHGVRFLIFFFGITCPGFLFAPRVELVHFLLRTIVATISVVASSFLATFGTKFQTSGVYGHVVIAHAPLQQCVLYETCVVFVATLLHIYLRAALCFPQSHFLSPNLRHMQKLCAYIAFVQKRKGGLYRIDLFRFSHSLLYERRVCVLPRLSLVVGPENCQPET